MTFEDLKITGGPAAGVGSGIGEEFDSQKALSEAAGFEVLVPGLLPSAEHYYLIAGKVADIRYDNGIIYRMTRRDDYGLDISGDWREYPSIRPYALDSYSVTARGIESLTYSAIWWDNDYTYSIYISLGTLPETVDELIRSLCAGR